jgi:acyl transferase domain-containing protein
MDSAASFGIRPMENRDSSLKTGKAILLFSGNSTQALASMAHQYVQYLKRHPERLDDVAYTLLERRERLKLASYCIVDAGECSIHSTPAKSSGTFQTAFVFTGQGECLNRIFRSVADLIRCSMVGNGKRAHD